MFNKIIKRGSRKAPKGDANEAAVFSYGTTGAGTYRGAGAGRSAVSGPHVTVTTVSSSVPSSSPLPDRSPPAVGAGAHGSAPIEALPAFRDVPVSERQNLFMRKVQICSVVFEFSDTLKNAREKEAKRLTLVELVDFIQSGSGRLTEPAQEELVRMISINIFRCLPPASHENTGAENTDPEEDEPYLDPAWPHLQAVYELLLRYVVSSDTDTKVAKRYIDHSFVLRLLDLFDSEDPREREYLKTILPGSSFSQKCDSSINPSSAVYIVFLAGEEMRRRTWRTSTYTADKNL